MLHLSYYAYSSYVQYVYLFELEINEFGFVCECECVF
jgi:hypothetical protein